MISTCCVLAPPFLRIPTRSNCACADFAGLGSWLHIWCWGQQKMVNMRSPSLLIVLWAHYLHAQVSPEWQLFEGFTERYNKPYQNDSGVKNVRFLAFKVQCVMQTWNSGHCWFVLPPRRVFNAKSGWTDTRLSVVAQQHMELINFQTSLPRNSEVAHSPTSSHVDWLPVSL